MGIQQVTEIHEEFICWISHGLLPATGIPQHILQEILQASEIHGEYFFLDTNTEDSTISAISMGKISSNQILFSIWFTDYHLQGQKNSSNFHFFE